MWDLWLEYKKKWMELKILDILPIIIIIGIGVVACVGALYFSDNLGMLNAVHPVSNVNQNNNITNNNTNTTNTSNGLSQTQQSNNQSYPSCY